MRKAVAKTKMIRRISLLIFISIFILLVAIILGRINPIIVGLTNQITIFGLTGLSFIGFLAGTALWFSHRRFCSFCHATWFSKHPFALEECPFCSSKDLELG